MVIHHIAKRKRDDDFEPSRHAYPPIAFHPPPVMYAPEIDWRHSYPPIFPAASTSAHHATLDAPPAKRPCVDDAPVPPATPPVFVAPVPPAPHPALVALVQPAAPPAPIASSSTRRGPKKLKPPVLDPVARELGEKRPAPFKKRCPQTVGWRIHKMFAQEIFLVDRKRVEGELKEVFKVVGSTGNIYTVTIQSKPSCTCPDAKKCPNLCKHILFIYVKVLQVPLSSNLWYQKGLFKSELETIFAIAPPNTPDAALPEPRIIEAYGIATGKIPRLSSTEAPVEMDCSGNCHMPGEDDDCPICFEGMHGLAALKLVFCEACGKAVHKECFKQWKKHKPQSALKCLYCMKRWPVPKSEYLNISDVIKEVNAV